MKNIVYSVAVMLALILANTSPLHAERRRAVNAEVDVVSLEFVEIADSDSMLVASGSDAWVDMRSVSQQAGSMGRSLKLRRRFGVRVMRSSGVQWGTATITARIQTPDGRSQLRIDGQPLSSASIVVDPRATIGTMSVHTLEIEVPDSVSAGALAASIAWEATTR